MVSQCSTCRCTAKPKPFQKVSTNSMGCEFNDIVSIDQCSLDVICKIHITNALKRCSASLVVHSTLLANEVQALKPFWASSFRSPKTVWSNQDFPQSVFFGYVKWVKHTTSACSTPLLLDKRPRVRARRSQNFFFFANYRCIACYVHKNYCFASHTYSRRPLLQSRFFLR